MKFVRGIFIMMMVFALAACSGGQSEPPAAEESQPAAEESQPAAEESGTLTVASWGGAYQEAQTNAWFDPFTAETGVTVIQDSPTDYAKVQAMVEAGQVTWDVVDIENDFAIGQSEEFFEPIDYSIVPKDQIIPGLANEYRVGNILYATVLGYSTDMLAEVPQGWADFFDLEKFPVTRSLPRSASRFVLEMALVADGADSNDLYPLDIDRALAKLDTIKDDTIFWETGAQSAQQLADGEAVMGMIWNGRVQTAIDEGAPLAIQWNQHIALADYWAVPKGAPNKEAAMHFIAFTLSDQNSHKISDFISYAPTNVETFAKVNADMAPLLPTYEDRPAQSFQVSDAWWDVNRETTVERYNEWLLE